MERSIDSSAAAVRPLRLGVIGLSEGNGHPYSWSAILNGYDAAAMEQCGFPVIPRYLEKQRWPEDRLPGAEVTHVWTQDLALSQRIAAAAKIGTVCRSLEDLLGPVDAVLLARDDGENHLELARPFLRHGLPVFIDKPLAHDRATAQAIFELEQFPGQVFSCSALRYAADFMPTPERRETLGTLRHVVATTPKRWERYGMHLIDAVLPWLAADDRVVESHTVRTAQTTVLNARWNSGLTTVFQALGDAVAPIEVSLFGTRGRLDLRLVDTFNAFKASLAVFLDSVRQRRPALSTAEMLRSVELLEMGLVAPRT